MSIYVPGTGSGATQTHAIMGESIYVPYHAPDGMFKLGTRVPLAVRDRERIMALRRALDARSQEYTTRRTT